MSKDYRKRKEYNPWPDYISIGAGGLAIMLSILEFVSTKSINWFYCGGGLFLVLLGILSLLRKKN